MLYNGISGVGNSVFDIRDTFGLVSVLYEYDGEGANKEEGNGGKGQYKVLDTHAQAFGAKGGEVFFIENAMGKHAQPFLQAQEYEGKDKKQGEDT